MEDIAEIKAGFATLGGDWLGTLGNLIEIFLILHGFIIAYVLRKCDEAGVV